MKFVLHVLKKRLQSEKHCLQVHGKLLHDKRFAASARMAAERIPQLEKAIEILSQTNVIVENSVCAKCGGKGYYHINDSVTATTPCDCQQVMTLSVVQDVCKYCNGRGYNYVDHKTMPCICSNMTGGEVFLNPKSTRA